jgi:hypothetical protein
MIMTDFLKMKTIDFSMDETEEELINHSNVMNVYDFVFLYKYYQCKGHWNFILQQISNILITFFVGILTFNLMRLDWNKLLFQYEVVYIPIDFTVWTVLVIGNMIMIFLFCLWFVLYLLSSMKSLYKTKQLITNVLTTDDQEFSRLSWTQLINKISKRHGCDHDALLARVNSRIMKNENFINHIIRTNELNLNFGDTRYRIPFTSINIWTMKQLVCDIDNFTSSKFKKTSCIYGTIYLILIPFTFIPIIVYIFMRQAEQYHAKREEFSSRSWTQYTIAKIQNHDELPHVFRKRLLVASKAADKYLVRFSNPLIVTLARNISFIAGSIMTIITIIAFINEDALIEIVVFNRNLLSILAATTFIFAVSRYMLPNPHDLLIPHNESMEKLSTALNLNVEISRDWIENANTDRIYSYIGSMYRFRYIVLLRDLLSFILLPYLFWTILPRNYQNIFESKLTFNRRCII